MYFCVKKELAASEECRLQFQAYRRYCRLHGSMASEGGLALIGNFARFVVGTCTRHRTTARMNPGS